MMKVYLFIGGPEHGKLLPVDPESSRCNRPEWVNPFRYTVAVYEKKKFVYIEYTEPLNRMRVYTLYKYTTDSHTNQEVMSEIERSGIEPDEVRLMGRPIKRCCRCKTMKSTASFPKNRSRRDGYGDWCKACSKEHVQLKKQKQEEIKRERLRSAVRRSIHQVGDSFLRSVHREVYRKRRHRQ